MPKLHVSKNEIIWMSIASILIPAILLIGALTYVAFYSGGYSLFQKIVILVIALIVAVVLECIMWLCWAGKKGFMSWQDK